MLVALDTATSTASVALYDLEHESLLAEQTWRAHRRQTEEILPVLAQMLARLHREPDQIQALAVTTGPGSFTGVRIGVSVVKGIALGLATPPRIIGLPTLSGAAAPLLPLARAAGVEEIWAVLQAGRGRLNWTIFHVQHDLWRPAATDHHGGRMETLVEALSTVIEPVWVVGEFVPGLAEATAHLPHIHVVDPVAGTRRAGNLARLAARFLDAGVEDDVNSLNAIYLRTLD